MFQKANTSQLSKGAIQPRNLLIRYALALGIILACVTQSHLASLSVINEIKSSAELISESIQQKEAVRRAVSFAELAQTFRSQYAVDQLTTTLDLLEKTHQHLSEAAQEAAEVHKVYFEGGAGPALNPLMLKFIEDGRIVASQSSTKEQANDALRRMQRVARRTLPDTLQEASDSHQRPSRGRSQKLDAVQKAAFALALLVLTFEAIFIFLPAHRHVRRSIAALSAQAQRLEEAHDMLEVRNRQLEKLRSDAEHEALHDQLTGLANRRGFQREIERRTNQIAQGGGGIVVMQIDLDRFKEINDTLGHSAGDALLRHVAHVMKRSVRSDDFVARIGGDEFVIVRDCDGDREALNQRANALIASLSEPVEIEGSLCQFGASVGIAIGVSSCTGPDMDSARLVSDADIALYHAKERGRGRVEFFTEELRRGVETCKALSDEFSNGLQRGEFFPVYQPQFDTVTGALCGVEALVRWRHPTQGVLPPGVFLPIAERLRKTSEIDAIVQKQVARDLAEWDAMGVEIPYVSINVSPARLAEPDLIEQLKAHPHLRGRIRVEVLETAFTDEISDELRHVLDTLRELGVKLEIDDFGTGHASLLGLLSLSPSRLKVARELVVPLPHSSVHAQLIRSISEIARSLDIKVTAEGVETAEQRDILVELGCDRVQGYYFARPMVAEELVKLASAPENFAAKTGAVAKHGAATA